MPGEANAFQYKINQLIEKLKTEKDPVEIARLQDAIKELKEELQKNNGRLG